MSLREKIAKDEALRKVVRYGRTCPVDRNSLEFGKTERRPGRQEQRLQTQAFTICNTFDLRAHPE